jgi:hypothetical protein
MRNSVQKHMGIISCGEVHFKLKLGTTPSISRRQHPMTQKQT